MLWYVLLLQMEHNDEILELKELIQTEKTERMEMREGHTKALSELKENHKSMIQEVCLVYIFGILMQCCNDSTNVILLLCT